MELTVEQLKEGAKRAAQAGDLATARSLIARARAIEGSAPAPKRAENVVAETPGVEGGRVVRLDDGSLAFQSPGAATTDPDVIERLIRGATYADATRPGVQETLVQENTGRARAATALQGVPFLGQYADEATGAMFGDDAMMRQRALADAFNERRPGQSLGLKVGTGLLSAIPAALAAGPAIVASAPTSMAGKVLTGILAGAAGGGIEGAVSGYGAGTTPEERMARAGEWGGEGAVAGGLTAGLLPLVASGFRRVADPIIDRFSGQSRTIPGLSREASEQVLLRAQADDIAGAGSANIAAAGSQGMIADAGPAMQGLADQAVNMSPSGANIAGRAVNERAAATAGNLAETFDDILGNAQGQKALAQAIRDDARPGINAAYEAAYSRIIDYSAPEGRAIEQIVGKMPKRVVQEAARRAQERMTYDGLPVPQVLVQLAEDGTVTASRLPNVMELDYMKRALDAIARDGTDVMGKMSDDAAFASRIARDLRGAIKDAVPEYAEALDKASDAFALERARQMGSSLLNRQTTREAVADWLEDAGTLEKRSLAAALRSDIDERMANATRAAGSVEGVAEARKIWNALSSPASREKMTAVLGQKEADRIFKALEQAEKALELKSAVARNSATAPRLVGDANLRSAQQYSPGEILREAGSGGVLTAPRRVAEIAVGNTPADVAARNDALYAEIAQYLTGMRGNAALQQAGIMGSVLRYAPRATAAGRAFGRVGSGLLGGLGYLSATQSQR